MSDPIRRLLQDGLPDEDLLRGLHDDAPALGRDPFQELAEQEPEALWPQTPAEFAALLARAESTLLGRQPEEPPMERGAPAEARTGRTQRTAAEPERARRRPLPHLEELEPEQAATILERWLPTAERTRLAALAHLVDGDLPFDRFGFSPAVTRRAFPFFLALHRLYFRVRSHGHHHIPTQGPAVLAANHAGLFPFDGAMTVVDVLLHTDPPRLPRAVVDRWAGGLPWVNVFFARVGQLIGTRENVEDVLDDGQLLLVFPEGMAGARKRVTQRYRLQSFHCGFVEHALRARAPIVPMAVVGSDDQAPILFDLPGLAKRLGLPVFPVTPTFPWLGPLGLLPYPVRYRIVYGEPLPFHERFGPEAAEDPRLVQHLAQEVRRAVQKLLDRHRA